MTARFVARQVTGVRACCLLASLAAYIPLGQAQSDQELSALIFDPVPIALTIGDDGSSTVQELSSLPQEQAVPLQEWLNANLRADQAYSEPPESAIRRHELLVREVEISEGPYSPGLPQQLQALGLALQANGDLVQAQKYFEQAMHITRVNHGLFSEAQIPYIRHSINNHLRNGDLFAADEQHRYLFYLNQRNLGSNSTALLPALQDYAEWNIFAFNAPASIPALSLEGSSSGGSVDSAMFRVERLLNAQHIYWSMVQILVNNFGSNDPRLLDAEKRIALANWFFATSVAPEGESINLGSANVPGSAAGAGLAAASSLGSMGYRQGRDALERRRNYMREMDTVGGEDLLRASLDLADWMLYFNRQRMKGIDMYDEIRAEFAQTLAPEALTAVLSPAYPELIPSFIKPSWSRAALGVPPEQALEYKGYIDVEFSMNRFGRTTTVKVLDSSDPTAELVEQRLLRSLRRSQFRPRFDGEQLRSSDTIQARYYYTW